MGLVCKSFTNQNYSPIKSQPYLDHGPGVRNKGILDEPRGPRVSGNCSGLHNLVEELGR